MSTQLEEFTLVGELAYHQRAKLAQPHNRLKQHWEQASDHYLFSRLVQEVEELRDAVYNNDSNAWEEAADIANFAAMIASNNE